MDQTQSWGKEGSEKSWQDKVKQTELYHKSCLGRDPEHVLADTAKELGRSIGRISEDIMLAEWSRKDPKVFKQRTLSDALEYVRKMKKILKTKV